MDAKKFLLLRHARTQGNLERRYLGDPEEPLCAQGVREAEALARGAILPAVTTLLSGPALRCRQTAALLFPDLPCAVWPLTEIDFGVFKGKNADELLDDKDYAQWLDGGCTGDIPGGEGIAAFKERCAQTFARIAETAGPGITALVVHGGNIMAVLERFALPGQDFYAYQVPNCGFFLCRYENGALFIELQGGSPCRS